MYMNSFIKTEDGAVHTTLPSGRKLHIIKTDAERGAYVEEPGAILVLDDRDTGNPSFQILRSYAVRDETEMRAILDAIIAFDREQPSKKAWNRSMDSLLKEWKLHNFAYRLHVYRKSSADVDLDNYDEGKGYLRFFVTSTERIIKLLWKKARILVAEKRPRV